MDGENRNRSRFSHAKFYLCGGLWNKRREQTLRCSDVSNFSFSSYNVFIYKFQGAFGDENLSNVCRNVRAENAYSQFMVT